MVLEKVGDRVLQMPDFKHDIGPNDSLNPDEHVFSGSWRRHRGIEQPLIRIREFIEQVVGDSHQNVINLLDTPIAIVLGANCAFSQQDVAQFLVWRYRGCKPIAVFDTQTGRRTQ